MDSVRLKQPRSARKSELQTLAPYSSASSASAIEQGTVATEAKLIELCDPSSFGLCG